MEATDFPTQNLVEPFEQIKQDFDFERPNKDLYVYQKKRDTGKRWGEKGDYLMKISFDGE